MGEEQDADGQGEDDDQITQSREFHVTPEVAQSLRACPWHLFVSRTSSPAREISIPYLNRPPDILL